MSAVAAANSQQRIGVFGGAFDPPHLAHVALAQAAVNTLQLDSLLVIPTGNAWHKARTLSDATHRLEMARLTFEGVPRVQVDDREVRRPGPSFTIDTLQALQAEHPGCQLYLIMGADQFAAFKQWRRWEDICRIAIITIANRPMNDWASGLFDAQTDAQATPDIAFTPLALPLMPHSATQIRELAATGPGGIREISSMVSESVARYISVNCLYQNP